VFSSGVDAWILVDASPEDLADYYAEKAAEDARRSTARVLDAMLAGEPAQVYYQFAMSFSEADSASREHDGPWWRDGEWANLREVTE
jgi:hypothetical protein